MNSKDTAEVAVSRPPEWAELVSEWVRPEEWNEPEGVSRTWRHAKHLSEWLYRPEWTVTPYPDSPRYMVCLELRSESYSQTVHVDRDKLPAAFRRLSASLVTFRGTE